MQQRLRRQNLKFGKSLKVLRVESVNSLNAIDFHGSDNLQIEYVAAGHRATTQQAKQLFQRVHRDGQHLKKSKQPGKGGQCVSGRTRLWNAPRIGDNGIKLAEYLRGHIKSYGRVTCSFNPETALDLVV